MYYYCLGASKKPERYACEKSLIRQLFHRHKGRYGYRRVTLALRNLGHYLNHKTVQRLMVAMGLRSTVRPKRYRSYRGGLGGPAPNLLNRRFIAKHPYCKWVTDVTEFRVRDEKVYLSPIMDLYNQEIVSYGLSKKPVLSLVLNMLDEAIRKAGDITGLMLHSDQGWQYRMADYQERLRSHGAQVSMSRKGNCHDNAVMEGFFGILKSECFHDKHFANADALIKEVKSYIHYYNHERIKEKLKGLSPVQYRTQALCPAN